MKKHKMAGIPRRRRPEQRHFPNIDADLHAIAVLIHDEIKRVLKEDIAMSGRDVIKVKGMIDILLTIKKSAPHLAAPKKDKETNNIPDNAEVIDG